MSAQSSLVRTITRLVVSAAGGDLADHVVATEGPYAPPDEALTDAPFDAQLAVDICHKVLPTIVLGGEVGDLYQHAHPDLHIWTPALHADSRDSAVLAIGRNDLRDALSDIEITFIATAHAPPRTYVEWRMSARFSGAYFVGDDLLLEPNGRRIALSGVLVAIMRGERLAAAHCYYDDVAVLEQMLAGV